MDKDKQKMDKNEHVITYLEDNNTLVGTRRRRLIDAETGESIEVNQVTKLIYGSKHFWKCYMREFLAVLKTLNSKQFKIFIYIVENTHPSTNKFEGTYKDIMQNTDCCRQTVAVAMRKLQESNFIRKSRNGVWMVNPDVLMKGNDKKYYGLRSSYNECTFVEHIQEDKNLK